jgi:iron complex transport system substrate-binding protein
MGERNRAVPEMKIVSLLPAATEIVCALGLEDQLVGVTHECDYPDAVRHLPKVTRSLIPGTHSSGEIDALVREHSAAQRPLYTLNTDLLRELQPDLIVTQSLCGVCAVADAEVQAAVCALPNAARIVSLSPETIWEVLDSVRHLSRVAGVAERGERTAQSLARRIDIVMSRSMDVRVQPRVAFLEWLDPPFSCGHWTPELVSLAGGSEVLAEEGARSRTLTWNEVLANEPEVVVIACCGFDVERTLNELHLLDAVDGWHELPAVRNGHVFVIDGSQYFSRPGPRLVDSLEILAHALHPDRNPLPNGLPPLSHLQLQPAFSSRHG